LVFGDGFSPTNDTVLADPTLVVLALRPTRKRIPRNANRAADHGDVHGYDDAPQNLVVLT